MKLQSEELVEVLEAVAKAAVFLEEKGFCKNRFMDEQGKICLSSALVLGGGGIVEPPPAGGIGRVTGTTLSDKVEDFVAKELGFNPTPSTSWHTVRNHNCEWNNLPQQTKETAVAMLRKIVNGEAVN